MALTETEAALMDGPIVWGTYRAVADTHPTYTALAEAHLTYSTVGFVGAGRMEGDQ